MRPNLQKIATEVGVSQMTVSRALRGIGRVNSDTRKRIFETAKGLGYHTKAEGALFGTMVRDLQHLRVIVASKPFRIGAAHDPNSLHGQIISGLEEQLALAEGKLLEVPFESLDQILAEIKRFRPHGVVLRQPYHQTWLDRISKEAVVVYAASFDQQMGVDSIYTNEHRSAILIYQHLRKLGHREIAWFGIFDKNEGDNEKDRLQENVCSSIHNLRYAAWANLACCQVNQNRQPMILIERDWETADLEQAINKGIDEILNLRPQPTAIVVAADPMGCKLVEMLNQRGLKVPEDISVVSYGGDQCDLNDGRKLTTVNLPMRSIGRVIPELIRRRLADPTALPVSMQLETTLKAGDSSGPCREFLNGAPGK